MLTGVSEKTRGGYLLKAKRAFLEGLSFKTPAEAVKAGARSSLEWCDLLALERARNNPSQDQNEEAQDSESKAVKARRVRGLDRSND